MAMNVSHIKTNDGQIQMAAPESRRPTLIPNSLQSQRRCVATHVPDTVGLDTEGCPEQ